jgi:hypothetical protein
MASQFIFTVSTDILSAKCDTDRLDEEIRNSAIVTALDGVQLVGDAVTIDFKADLSAGDETILHGDTTGPAGGLVGTHSGEPLPDPLTADGIPKVHLDSPEEIDGKLLVTPTPSPGKGWKTYYTSAGDHVTNGRGKGDELSLDMAGGGDTLVADITFNEPTFMHDGQITWNPAEFSHTDSFSVSLIMPATPLTSTPGTGNCNLAPVGAGINIIVPAAGDGSHTLDLATAVPIPSTAQTGYFDADMTTGVLSFSSTPGNAKFNLFDFQIQTFFIPKIVMGNPRGVFDVDAYQSEWVSHHWSIRMECTKNSAGTANVCGWVMVYRRNTTTF